MNFSRDLIDSFAQKRWTNADGKSCSTIIRSVRGRKRGRSHCSRGHVESWVEFNAVEVKHSAVVTLNVKDKIGMCGNIVHRERLAVIRRSEFGICVRAKRVCRRGEAAV